MNDIPEERCSCNARLKHKCCKESTLGGGKMCVKENKFEILKERLQRAEETLNYLRQLRPLVDSGNGYSTAISFEQMSDYAIKWMEQQTDVILEEESVPIPPELVARMKAVQDKAEVNKSRDSDIFMLLYYLDRALHFMESLEEKGVKMRTEKQNLEFLIDGIGEWRENNEI